MAGLSDFDKMFPELSPGETAQILKWMVQDLGDAFPGIDSRSDVCGGEPCIIRTRIPVWLLDKGEVWAPVSGNCWPPTLPPRRGPGERLGLRALPRSRDR